MSFTLKDLKELLSRPDVDENTDLSSLITTKEQVLVTPELPTQINFPTEYSPRIFHAVNPGDLIAAMGSIKKMSEGFNRKVIVCQSVSQLAAYYQGATHPTVNESGQNVCVNIPVWNMLKPLIESQPYVHSFEKYEGQKLDFDFNVIRGKTSVNLPNGLIQGWISFAFPDLSFDLTKPWIVLNDECPIHIKKQVSGKIILNFTERYRSNMVDYFFLKNYMSDLIFAGTEREHFLFTSQWQLPIPRLEVSDFLELAYAIKEARFLLANQSMNWNLAESMKTPRILEVCTYAQNCAPMVGEDSFGYFYTVGVEHYFRQLYNKTLNK